LLPDTIEFLTTTKKLSIVSAIAVFSNPVRTAISLTISDFVIIIEVQKKYKSRSFAKVYAKSYPNFVKMVQS
jgi:hypothetical protein